jgi:hypothetical protein
MGYTILAGPTTTCVSHEKLDFNSSWDMQPYRVWFGTFHSHSYSLLFFHSPTRRHSFDMNGHGVLQVTISAQEPLAHLFLSPKSTGVVAAHGPAIARHRLFACPEYPPTSSGSNTKLPCFIAYTFHRTKLHSLVTFASLVLLQRLTARFPTVHGSSGHCLFISAFMIASKVICDNIYLNKSWSMVGQGMFQLVDQPDRVGDVPVAGYLDRELVEPSTLKEFEDMVHKDFAGPGP